MPKGKLAMNQATIGGLGFRESVEQCAAAGYEGIGVSLHRLADVGVAEGSRIIREAGLGVSTLTVTGFWHGSLHDHSSGEPMRRPTWEELQALQPTLIESTKRNIEIAAELEADCMMLLTGWAGPQTWEEATDRFVDAVGQILPTAEAAGVQLACETLQPILADYSHLHTLRDAIDVAKQIDSPNFGVVLDFWHVWGERDLLGQIERDVDRIYLCQIDDFYADTASWRERAQLGDGIMPLTRIFGAMEDAGYARYYDVEIFSTRMSDAERATLIPDTKAAFDRIWASVEAGA